MHENGQVLKKTTAAATAHTRTADRHDGAGRSSRQRRAQVDGARRATPGDDPSVGRSTHSTPSCGRSCSSTPPISNSTVRASSCGPGACRASATTASSSCGRSCRATSRSASARRTSSGSRSTRCQAASCARGPTRASRARRPCATCCSLGNRCASCSARSSGRSTTTHAPEGITLDDVVALGPINVLKVKFAPAGLQRKMVAELWFYPDGSHILELSTKCAPADALRVADEARASCADAASTSAATNRRRRARPCASSRRSCRSGGELCRRSRPSSSSGPSGCPSMSVARPRRGSASRSGGSACARVRRT